MTKLMILLAMLGQLPTDEELLNGFPKEVPLGQLTILDGSLIPATKFTWLLANPPNDDKHIILSDRRLIFSTGVSGIYRFTLAFIPEGEANADTEIKILDHYLKVGSGIAPNPPDPNDDPVVPDGQFGLALLSRQLALSQSDPSAAATIAEVYRYIAKEVSKGNLKSKPLRFGEEIEEATTERLLAEVGREVMVEWGPTWGKAIGERINDLKEDSKIQTDAEYLTAYNEIALGLESIENGDEDDKPPSGDIAYVVIVEETSKRTPAEADLLTDLAWQESLGVKFRLYDKDSDDASDYLAEIDQNNLPQVLLMEEDGTVIGSFKLPANQAEMERKLK